MGAAPRSITVLACAALALLAVLPPAAAQEVEETQVLEPGQPLHPVPTRLLPGDRLHFDWRVAEPAGARLEFSTHIHVGAQVVNLTHEEVDRKVGDLVADRDGLYSVQWLNTGNRTITLVYTLTEHRQPAETPWPGLAALAAPAAAALLAGRRR